MQLRVNSIYISFGIAIILSFVVLAIGLRPVTVGSDTLAYTNYYHFLMENISTSFAREYLFEIITRCMATIQLTDGWFFSLYALLNYIILLFFIKNLAHYFSTIGSYRLFFLIMTFLSISPFFLSSQINVLRHGIAILLLFVYYLALLQRRHILFLLLLSFLALGFHYTSALCLLFSGLIYFSYSTVFRSMLLLAACYCLGGMNYILQHVSLAVYEKIMKYGELSGYSSGIRYDFALFTVGIGCLFHMLAQYALYDLEQKKFINVLKIYWLLTFPFFFMGFGAYSDRYLLPAWMFLSIVAAVFTGLKLKKQNIPISVYFLFFFLSSSYFILRAQGIVG